MAIRILSTEVSSKIAAGEVVERPASVVKELVENALDAEASRVSVDIDNGGAERIRVADDGRGIAADEAELAFQRFATSKISRAEELEAIQTLGFRGEALASIAAVSTVILVTRQAGEETGARIEVADGEVLRTGPHGASPGTVVTVRQLFRNFPARRKFLRSPASESARIRTVVTRYALDYPEVRFQLTVDGSPVFASTGSGDLREAIAAVYKREIAEAMLELGTTAGTGEPDHPVVSGMISPPSLDKANRSYISFFVNRRWVQSRILGYALEQAYQGFLKERRFPLGVINISLPLEDVDVNVHPSKVEVRFRSERQVFAALQQAVRHTLTTHSPIPEVRRHAEPTSHRAAQAGAPAFWPSAISAAPASSPATPSPAGETEMGPPLPTLPLAPKGVLPVLRVLGQVQNTYIAAEGPDGMYLVDQHASHERVVFEQVRADALSRTPRMQGLLEPVVVELDELQRELVEGQLDLVSRLGFDVGPFGGSGYVLRAVPSLLAESDPRQSFVDFLDLLGEGGGFESWEERAAYSIACHGAIRAGKVLSQQEMSELVRRLEQCQQPHTCPHGRPTMLHLSSSHLEREFGRA